jgi:hypothetical protein
LLITSSTQRWRHWQYIGNNDTDADSQERIRDNLSSSATEMIIAHRLHHTIKDSDRGIITEHDDPQRLFERDNREKSSSSTTPSKDAWCILITDNSRSFYVCVSSIERSIVFCHFTALALKSSGQQHHHHSMMLYTTHRMPCAASQSVACHSRGKCDSQTE